MASSSSYFQSIFNAALETYEKVTKNKLLAHPLAAQLQSCDSPAAIMPVPKTLVQESEKRPSCDDRLRKWLDPTVNVLYTFSATLGGGIGYLIRIRPLIIVLQAFPSAIVIFTGISFLLSVSL